MPTNPFALGLMGAGGGGTATLGGLSTAGGGAAEKSGSIWTIALPIIFSLLSSSGIFGGESEEEKSRRQFEQQKELIKMLLAWQNPTYRSPYIPGLDKTMIQALLNQTKRTTNWGYPAGMQMDTSFIEELLKAIPTIPQNTGLSQVIPTANTGNTRIPILTKPTIF